MATTCELINALKNGQMIEKDYARAYPLQYGADEIGKNIMKVEMGGESFHKYGWASATVSDEGLLRDILIHPERWEVSKPITLDTPFPSKLEFYRLMSEYIKEDGMQIPDLMKNWALGFCQKYFVLKPTD